MEMYRTALNEHVEQYGINKGFRMKDNVMQTYELPKVILSSRYSKRKLLDNVYTRPLMPDECDCEIKIEPKNYIAERSKNTERKLWRHIVD